MPIQIDARWLTDRLRRNGHLDHGEVISVVITASGKHHFALQVTYSSEVTTPLPRKFILKWYEPGHRYGIREGLF